MNRLRIRQPARCALFALCAALSMTVSAAETAIVTVMVTVIAPPPCVINGNRTIDVDFGNVTTTDVNGENYLRTVNYTLECDSGAPKAMKMAIMGTPTLFDNSALQTNVTDFGIALRANGMPLPINNGWINFTWPNNPVLQAVPVKRAGVALKGGGFRAGATLLADYQ